MRRKAKRIGRHHWECPFCGLPNAPGALAWCAGCYTEYSVTEAGNVWFDDEKKTPRFALAKALAKAGGMGFGKEIESDE